MFRELSGTVLNEEMHYFFLLTLLSLAFGLKESMFPLLKRLILSTLGGDMKITYGLSFESRSTLRACKEKIRE